MNSKIWDRNYFLQGTSDMEPDSGKIKGIVNIKQILKRNEKIDVDSCSCRMCKTYIQCVGVTLILLVFPFSLTETSRQESILLILFHFSDDISYPCKCIL